RELDLIAQLAEQRLQLVAAAMDVTDDVEWPRLVAAVGPQTRADDLRTLDLLDRLEPMGLPESFPLQAAEAAVERSDVVANHMRSDLPIGALAVAVLAHALAGIQHDGNRQRVIRSRNPNVLPPILRPQVGGVHHREPSILQTLLHDELE